ncbi:MAG: sugar ABC transporter permease [Chloroflexi bacterium]|nr:MAG: sugar ABC transporter permease [Chloroflexota bacterium]
MRKSGALTAWVLMSPYLLYTLVFFAFPLVWSIWLLFHEQSLISPTGEFVGLGNFVKAFHSPKVLAAFLFSFKFGAVFIPTVIVLSLVIALMINTIPRLKPIFSTGYFLPYLASGVAMSLIVMGFLSWTSPFSQFLRRTLGYVPDWFGSPLLAVLVIGLMVAWKHSGYYALIFLAALQSIPRELYEVAMIDGAGPLRRFWRITVPMLYPAFYTVLILAVGLSFAIFSEPFVLTGGGPHYATHTWQLEIFYQLFDFGNAGYAATVAVLDAVATFLTVVSLRRLMRIWGRASGYET